MILGLHALGSVPLGYVPPVVEEEPEPQGAFYYHLRRAKHEAMVPVVPEILRSPDDIMGNRRRREDYNEYQKHYMRKYRGD